MPEEVVHNTIENDLDVLMASARCRGRPSAGRLGLAMGQEAPRIGDREAAVAAAAHAFAAVAGYDTAHANYVSKFALALHEQLAAIFDPAGLRLWSGPQGRTWLRTAAILHDVGLSAGYARHQKHSYRMISGWQCSDLLEAREVSIVALVARYHRRSGPKMRHVAFASLGEAERDAVARLAGILRVADGLDRTGLQIATAVRVRREASLLVVDVISPLRPAAGLQGALEKGRVLERSFGVDLRLEWRNPDDASPG